MIVEPLRKVKGLFCQLYGSGRHSIFLNTDYTVYSPSVTYVGYDSNLCNICYVVSRGQIQSSYNTAGRLAAYEIFHCFRI